MRQREPMRRHESITLRLAHRSDAPVIAAMSRDLIETGLGWSWTPERVARALADPNTLGLAALDRGTNPRGHLIGFALLYVGPEHGHLSLLAVRETHQRMGLGRRMMEWLVGSALTAGLATLHLELRNTNRGARRFYRSLGFTESAWVPGYYRGRETALRMKRTLRDPSLPLPAWNPPKIH